MRRQARTTDPAKDPLGRRHYGWGEHDNLEENWHNNRGYCVLGARANRESYVLFSCNQSHTVVMAAEIDKIVPARGQPGKRMIEGKLLPEDHPV